MVVVEKEWVCCLEKGRKKVGVVVGCLRMRIISLSCSQLGGLPGLTSHDDVPVVLDGVVSAAREKPCDDGPSVPVNPVRRQQPLLFLFCERPSVDSRIQLIEPSQTAALP